MKRFLLLAMTAIVAVGFTGCSKDNGGDLASVTGVTLAQTELTLTVGDSERLTANIAPAHATDKSVKWTSSAPTIASVGSDGKVTALAEGSATITVTTTDGAKTDDCAVTVNAASVLVNGVTLDEGTLTLYVGDSETLTATVAPADATNKSVKWTSSAPTIASVGSDGKVTALAEGSATITSPPLTEGRLTTAQ